MNKRKSGRKIMSSGNPFMGDAVMNKSYQEALTYEGQAMTVKGAVDKTFFLFAILMVVSALSFKMASMPLVIFGAIAGLITVFVSVWRPRYSNVTAPLYSIFEGLFIGGITAVYAAAFDGIVFKAVTLTFAVLFMMLFIYKSGIITVTNKLRNGIIMATGAVLIFYVLAIVLSFFGIDMPYLHQGGPIGIGISLVIIGIAAMNLLIDFDNFDKGEQNQLPRHFEWFFAMGLIVTLVWLYLEILRLLAMLQQD